VTATVEAVAGKGIAGDPTEDVRLTGETVVAIGGIDRVLLLRARAAVVSAFGQAPIPFDELVSPSGNLGMRGYPDGRFRGESGALGTAEYRYFVSAGLDAAIFTDVGTVGGPGFSGLPRGPWFPDFGAGLRLFSPFGRYWEMQPKLGFQVAYAPNSGIRLLLALAGF
jgi:outer membrane protein assembly factor BamA